MDLHLYREDVSEGCGSELASLDLSRALPGHLLSLFQVDLPGSIKTRLPVAAG